MLLGVDTEDDPPPPVVEDASQVYNRREVFGFVVRYFVSGPC